MEKYPVRVSYQWKKPEAKSHHGYAMGVVEAEGKTNEDVIKALKAKGVRLIDLKDWDAWAKAAKATEGNADYRTFERQSADDPAGEVLSSGILEEFELS